jgi:stringent starvation protein B
MMNTLDSTSTRPYMIRALYEWCTDNGYTPYVAVLVDETVRVPQEYVKNGEIVLNIGFDATSSLKLGNDFIEFKARFAGVAREIFFPVPRVVAIYAKENGQGMVFPAQPAKIDDMLVSASIADTDTSLKGAEPQRIQLAPFKVESATSSDLDPPRPPSGSRPALKRIK